MFWSTANCFEMKAEVFVKIIIRTRQSFRRYAQLFCQNMMFIGIFFDFCAVIAFVFSLLLNILHQYVNYHEKIFNPKKYIALL